MFQYISGSIDNLTPTACVVDVHGVGFYINITLPSFQELQGKTHAKLFVFESIREDAHTLFGFTTAEERELFLLLISVSGVGAGTARTIMSQLNKDELKNAIASEDLNTIKRVKGIGLKTAQRIIVDLREKVLTLGADASAKSASAPLPEAAQEAIAALVALGYQQGAAAKVVDKLIKEDDTMAVAKIIKRALSML